MEGGNQEEQLYAYITLRMGLHHNVDGTEQHILILVMQQVNLPFIHKENVIKRLLNGGVPTSSYYDRRIPLAYACENGYIEYIRLLANASPLFYTRKISYFAGDEYDEKNVLESFCVKTVTKEAVHLVLEAGALKYPVGHSECCDLVNNLIAARRLCKKAAIIWLGCAKKRNVMGSRDQRGLVGKAVWKSRLDDAWYETIVENDSLIAKLIP